MFSYPPKAAFNRVIAKSTIYQQAEPTPSVERLFVDQVARVVWKYKLAPETINLPERGYVREIQIFAIELKANELDEAVLQCIDRAIHFPIFYEVHAGEQVREMAAFKRPSDADPNKLVVGEYFATDWSLAAQSREPLPLLLDLSALHEHLLRQLMPYPARPDESLQSQAERMAEIRSKQKQRSKLEAKIAKEKQFNRKVEMNSELRAIQQEITQLTSAG